MREYKARGNAGKSPYEVQYVHFSDKSRQYMYITNTAMCMAEPPPSLQTIVVYVSFMRYIVRACGETATKRA